MLFSFFNRLDAHSWEITRWEWIVCVLSNSERDDDDDHLFPSLVSRFSASIILFLLLFAQKVFSPRDWLLNPRPHPPLIRWLSLCYLSISISRLAFFFYFSSYSSDPPQARRTTVINLPSLERLAGRLDRATHTTEAGPISNHLTLYRTS